MSTSLCELIHVVMATAGPADAMQLGPAPCHWVQVVSFSEFVLA